MGPEKPEGRYTLPMTAAFCFWRRLLLVVPPRLSLIGFTYAQPFLITRAIDFLSEPDTVNSKNIGYGLIGATGLIYLGIAISTARYRQGFYRIITMFRRSMVSMIYDRTLTLQDGVYTESAAITLMSTDIDSIVEAYEEINEIWARTIEVAIGIYLLERQVGVMCVVPVIVVIGCTFGQSWVANHIGDRQQKCNEAIQKRVAVTSCR